MSSSRLPVRDLSYRDRSRSPGRAGGRADTRVPEPIEMSLERVRILIQDHETDPFEAPPLLSTSRTFRVAVFALNFGLCILESPRGRRPRHRQCVGPEGPPWHGLLPGQGGTGRRR